MPFDDQHFFVDDQPLPWGLSLAEVDAGLSGRAWLVPYGGWPNLRSVCRSVLGLAAVECNLRGPAWHKPVLQVSYQLAPPPGHPGPGPADPAYWTAPLSQLLGPPTKAGPSANPAPGAGSVVYSAEWQRPQLHLSLSVYGGVRAEAAGPAAAGLYLHWQDELTAAAPYVAAAAARSNALNARFGWISRELIFRTAQPQTGYFWLPSPASTAEAARAETRLRQAQRALYRDNLCDTPTTLQEQLTEHEVALWPVRGRGATWAVSTKWDTTVLKAPDWPPLELHLLHPAKGSGTQWLAVGDLRLHDSYGAPGLGQLAAALERYAGAPVRRTEDYDC
jgi:hypothetical protein